MGVTRVPLSCGRIVQVTNLGTVKFILCAGDLCDGEEDVLVGTTSPLVITRMLAAGYSLSHCVGLYSRACEYLFTCMGVKLLPGEISALSAVVCMGIRRGHLYPLSNSASAECWFTRVLGAHYTHCSRTHGTGDWCSVSSLGPAGALANATLLPSLGV